jgi:hypothetical protein
MHVGKFKARACALNERFEEMRRGLVGNRNRDNAQKQNGQAFPFAANEDKTGGKRGNPPRMVELRQENEKRIKKCNARLVIHGAKERDINGIKHFH